MESLKSKQNPYCKDKNLCYIYSEAVDQRCSIKKLFLKISENVQKNTCARVSFLIKLQALFKKRPQLY